MHTDLQQYSYTVPSHADGHILPAFFLYLLFGRWFPRTRYARTIPTPPPNYVFLMTRQVIATLTNEVWAADIATDTTKRTAVVQAIINYYYSLRVAVIRNYCLTLP